MGLNIYFFNKHGDDVEYQEHLGITHNLNTVVDELGKLVGKPYYEVIWRPDELLDCKNGEVPVGFVLAYLPQMIKDLIEYGRVLEQHLPKNGWGSIEWLVSFLCDYLKECYRYKNEYVFCCR
jgi:hypothetical protein